MTDRSVVVRLKADTSAFTAKMVAAGRSAETAFLASSKAAEKNRAALRTVGNAAGIMGAAAAAGVGIAIKTAADFDKAMSSVEAATHGSAKTMGALREAALKAGADTAFSATEAAGGIENLAKAGVSTADILSGGLRGALNLAAAGQIEVADAAEYTATALTQFQLKGDQASHVADLLAAGAGKAQGEVGDMALALKYAGVPAANLGVSIEETAGSIALFAKNGIIGEQAGTTLRGMIASLSSPSSIAARTMQDLGISVFDAKGNFIGLDGVAGQLHDQMGNLTQAERANALGRIFGNEQLQGANVLYREGAKGVDLWTRKVNDQGYAAETAATKMDNLSGDLEQLRGSLETALIGAGSGAQGPLRGLTQGATNAVNAFNDLPQSVKTATLAFGGLVAVTGGAAFLGSRFIGAVAEAKLAMSQLGLTTRVTSGMMKTIGLRAGAGAIGGLALAFNHLDESADPATRTLGQFINVAGSAALGFSVGGPWGAAIGGAIGLVSAFASSNDQAAADVDALTGTLNQQTGALTRNSREWVAKRLQDQGAFDSARQLGIGLDTVTEAALRGGPALAELQRKLVAVVRAGTITTPEGPGYTEQARAAREMLDILGPVNDRVRESRREWSQQQEAMGKSAKATKDAADTTDWFSDVVVDDTRAVKGETSAVQDNIDAHNQRASALLEDIDKQLGWKQALIDGRKEARQGTKTLNLNTQAGIDNKTSLVATANAWKELTDKQKRGEGGIDAARREFVKQAMQMGATREQAQRLARQMLDIPDVKRKIEIDTEGAKRDVDNLVPTIEHKLADIDDETVNVQLSGLAKLALEGQGPLMKKFGGGIPGYLGTRGKDSVHVLAEPDEHVVTTKEVLAAGKGNAARGHRIWKGIRHAALVGALPDPMDLPAYATGGPVTVDPHLSQSGFPTAIRSIEAAFNGVVDRLGVQLSDRINEMYRFGGGAPLGPGGSLSRGQIMMGQRFAQAQAGKPYIWGGVGPTGYDCSGYQSAITNAALGRNPYQRIGSTGTMPWPGMSGGTGLYTIGWFTGDPGHTSGNIGGLNVESTGDHVRNGSAARSPLNSMFNHVGHYDDAPRLRPGWTAAYNGTGADEYVVKGYAEGGKVTKAERQANREEREANREERQAKREEREKQARENARLFEHALKAFDITKKMGREDVASELRDLRGSLREALGKDSPALKTLDRLDGHLMKHAVQQGKLLHSQEKLTESLKSLKDKRDEYAAGVAGTFRNEIFGGGLDDLSLQLRADTNDAKAMRRALQVAEHKGLSGGLYSGLAASGNMLLAQQFAHLSRQQIARYERMFAGRQGATTALGRTAGGEVFGQRIHENSRALHRVHRELGHNTRQMRRLGRTLERRVVKADSGAHKRARGG